MLMTVFVRRIKTPIAPIAAAVHLRPPPRRQAPHQQGDTKDDRRKFHASRAPPHRIIFHKLNSCPETAVASMVRFLRPSPPNSNNIRYANRATEKTLGAAPRNAQPSAPNWNPFLFLTAWRSSPSRFIPSLASTRPKARFLTMWCGINLNGSCPFLHRAPNWVSRVNGRASKLRCPGGTHLGRSKSLPSEQPSALGGTCRTRPPLS